MALPGLTILTITIILALLLRLICSHRSLLRCISQFWRFVGDRLEAYQHFTVPRYHPDSRENNLYFKVATYISCLPHLEDSDSVSLVSGVYNTSGTNEFDIHLGPGETVCDSFRGFNITWTKPSDGHDRFVLCIGRQDRVHVLRPYLMHVENEAAKIKLNSRQLRFFTHTSSKNGRSKWIPMPSAHPATFDTLVIHPALKKQVRADLESFMKNRSYYHRIGRVWNHSYLVYGPPGTGKSSFAVAMARALCFDLCIIDMSHCSVELLETLVINTRPRSLILFENLDVYLNKTPVSENASIHSITNRVFSCCGDERIMVFTMTGDRDWGEHMAVPVGTFNMCVYLPLCDFNAFKKLAERYLGVRDHELFPTVEEGFQRGLQISPARVGEIMLANRQSMAQTIRVLLEAVESTAAIKVSSSSNESRNQPIPTETCDRQEDATRQSMDKQAVVGEDGKDGGTSKKDKNPNLTKICKLLHIGNGQEVITRKPN